MQSQHVDTKGESFGFGEVIHSYTRAEAIADGFLVDVSEQAKVAGIRFPVAMTRTVWTDCVEWDEETTERMRHPQDELVRLYDVLKALKEQIRHTQGDRCLFRLFRVPSTGGSWLPQGVRLLATCGPGDTAAPVITIMFEGEE